MNCPSCHKPTKTPEKCADCVQLEKEKQVFKFSPLMDWSLSWRDFA